MEERVEAALSAAAEARDALDVCPECGGDFIDTDASMAGSVVFLHDEDPITESCSVEPSDLDL